jgi:hypothetical protein
VPRYLERCTRYAEAGGPASRAAGELPQQAPTSPRGIRLGQIQHTPSLITPDGSIQRSSLGGSGLEAASFVESVGEKGAGSAYAV